MPYLPHSPDPTHAKKRDMYLDNYGHCHGPVPFDMFLSRHVPAPSVSEHDVPNVENEKELLAALEKDIEGALKDIQLADTSNHSDTHSATGQTIGPYFTLYDVAVNPSTGKTQLNKIPPSDDKPRIDPFDDDAPPGHFEPPSGSPHSAAASQILLHAEETHARHHRVHSFSLLLTSAYFRLIRADRDGLLVTEKRGWKTADAALGYNCLAEFLRRLDSLPPALKGFATTVRPVQAENSAHEIRARQALQTHVPADERGKPILEMDVPCPTHGRRTFYVWAPSTQARAFHAWDPLREDVVLVKDCWRSAGPRRPAVACHPRARHRLAETLGVPLWLCKSERHLLEILLDALQGHRGAVTECGTLHRDISARNIVWDERTGRGFLVDWDLCAPTPDPAVDMPAQQRAGSARTGTWAFMSIGQLQVPDKPHDVQDDLEALFWVGVYIIILYFPFDRAHALSILDAVFSPARYVDGVPFGGGEKRTFLADPTILHFALQTPLLKEWFEMYRGMLQGWVAYQDRLRSWTRAQKQSAEHSDGANPGHDADADSDSDDEPPPDVSRPRAPALRDYARLEKRWTELLAKRSFKDHARLADELHTRPPEEVIAAYRKLNEAEKLARLTSEGSEQQPRSQSARPVIDSGRADVRVEAEADAVVDEAVDFNAGDEVDNAKGEEVVRASKRQKTS